MNKCFICNTNHQESYKSCNIIINVMITKYKDYNKDLYMNELLSIKIKKSKNKKYKCENCGLILSSITNYKLHKEKQSCKVHNKDFKCKKCEKIFIKKQSLQYHLENNVCETINQLIKDNKKTPINKNVSNTNTTNIQTQNINNGNINNGNQINNNVVINVNSNITEDLKKVVELLPFREASYKIPIKKYLEYANNPDQAIKKFVKDYHLNPNKPERHNVLNTNRRDNRVQLFDFDEDFVCRWQTKDKATVMELLCDRGVNALFFAKTMLTAAGIKLDPKKESALNAKIKEYETNDKIKKKYIDMVSDLTYDFRNMIESNKKLNQNLQLNN